MARHRIHSLAFKKQVVQEYAAGATLNGLAREHDLSRNLIRIWIDANVVALQGARERLSHAVRLWALQRGRAGHQPDVPGEAAGLPGDVAAAVVGQPPYLHGKTIGPPQ